MIVKIIPLLFLALKPLYPFTLPPLGYMNVCGQQKKPSHFTFQLDFIVKGDEPHVIESALMGVTSCSSEFVVR